MYLKMTLTDKKYAIKLINAWAKVKDIALIYWVSSPTICNLIQNKHKKLIIKERNEELKKEKLNNYTDFFIERRKAKEEQEKLKIEKHKQLLFKINSERIDLEKKSNYWYEKEFVINSYYFK